MPRTASSTAITPLIETRHTGICHSDIHHAHSDWRPETYPLVSGHEIVGIGKDGRLAQGGYFTHVVVTEDFVLAIPEGTGLAEAAPLLCAGIMTYSPLRSWKDGSGTKVAVVGLGHMTVKFAHAMGAEVTVLSQPLKKQDDGLHLGADHYHAISDPAMFDKLAGSFDLIVNTVSPKLVINAYLLLLALDGAVVNVGAAAETLSFNAFPLLAHRRSVAGSMIGGIHETQ